MSEPSHNRSLPNAPPPSVPVDTHSPEPYPPVIVEGESGINPPPVVPNAQPTGISTFTKPVVIDSSKTRLVQP